MEREQIGGAARKLTEARLSRTPLPTLGDGFRPESFADAAAIQEEILSLLGETCAGYKVAGVTPETSNWGAVLKSRFYSNAATVAAADVPLLGVEAEVAFRLNVAVEAGDLSWDVARFDAAVTALPAIEIVDTRFVSYFDTPATERAADFMSNGGLIVGEPLESWKDVDLTRLPAKLTISGAVVAETVGGHSAGDARRPAIAFLNAPLRPRLPAGLVITAGTYTPLAFARPGDTVTAELGPFGSVSVHFA